MSQKSLFASSCLWVVAMKGQTKSIMKHLVSSHIWVLALVEKIH